MNPAETLEELIGDMKYLLDLVLEQNKLLNEKLEQAKQQQQRMQEQIQAERQENLKLQSQLHTVTDKIATLEEQRNASNRSAGDLQKQMKTLSEHLTRLVKYVYQKPAEAGTKKTASQRERRALQPEPKPSSKTSQFASKPAAFGPLAPEPAVSLTGAPQAVPLSRSTEEKKHTTRMKKRKTVTLTAIQKKTISKCRHSYDALCQSTSFDRREKRETFFRDYDVVPISCINNSERMVAPNVMPVFAQTDSVLKAHAWAVPLGGSLYAVFPRSHITYNSTYHTADAMSEVFESNYESGSYDTLHVESPALLQNTGGTWSIAEKGRLRLL